MSKHVYVYVHKIAANVTLQSHPVIVQTAVNLAVSRLSSISISLFYLSVRLLLKKDLNGNRVPIVSVISGHHLNIMRSVISEDQH